VKSVFLKSSSSLFKIEQQISLFENSDQNLIHKNKQKNTKGKSEKNK
jgi:hypothetical protein